MQIGQELINSVLEYNFTRQREITDLFRRSKNMKEGVPIKTRVYKIGGVEQTNKINNRLNNDFFNEIINIKVGFFAGVPVTVNLPRPSDEPDAKDIYNQEQYDNIMSEIRRWSNINNADNLNQETTKYTSIGGYSGRLLYMTADGDVGAYNIPAYQCFFVDDMQGNEIALHVYPILDITNKLNYVMACDVYDKTTVYKYKSKEIAYNQVMLTPYSSEWTFEDSKPHLFNDVPLIKFTNNLDEKGDAENVLELIDTYDRVLSDLDNEIEQQRLAYMVFRGCRPTQETVDAARQTGAFGFDDASADISFLIKDLNADAIFQMLKLVEGNIFYFTQTPNMRDEAFAGNMSGVALGYKIRPFESKCITMERQFEKSLRKQWQLISFVWAFKNKLVFDPYDLDFVFTRNYPQNLLEEADIQVKLKGLISEQTRLSLFSAVKDPYNELKQMEAEESDLVSMTVAKNMTGALDDELIE